MRKKGNELSLFIVMRKRKKTEVNNHKNDVVERKKQNAQNIMRKMFIRIFLDVQNCKFISKIQFFWKFFNKI